SRMDTSPAVIGVMPPGIRFLPSPTNAQEPNYNVNALVDYWLPARPDPARLTEPEWDVGARLKDGATLKKAQEELAIITARQVRAEHAFEGFTPLVESLTDESNRDGR